MVALAQVSRATSILTRLDESSGGDVIPLFTAGQTVAATEAKADAQYKGMVALLADLRAMVAINSTTQTAIPDIELEDSQTDALRKTLDAQWGTERKQLNILMSLDGTEWLLIGSISLLNPEGYPYNTVRLLDYFTDDTAFQLSDGAIIGVQLVDVGTGLLASGDTVNIYGALLEEFTFGIPQSSVGSIITPDLGSLEADITGITNTLSTVQAALNTLVTDAADDPEVADITALESKIDQLIANPGEELPMATVNTSVVIAVSAGTDALLIDAAVSPSNRKSIIICNDSTTAKIQIQYGDTTGAQFKPTFTLDEGAFFEERIWKGEIRGKSLAGTVDLKVSELN